jgi:hypothetical protein
MLREARRGTGQVESLYIARVRSLDVLKRCRSSEFERPAARSCLEIQRNPGVRVTCALQKQVNISTSCWPRGLLTASEQIRRRGEQQGDAAQTRMVGPLAELAHDPDRND